MRLFMFFVGFLGLTLGTAYTTGLTTYTCDSNGCNAASTRIALDVDSNHTSSAGQELISVNGDALTMSYGDSASGGPRVYLIETDGINKNHMFYLKNREFTFDVELSTMPCGFNAALYFVGMSANEGGAENGTNYCDAQAVAGTFCSEMDVMEANTVAQQFTTHACVDACSSFGTAEECQDASHAASSVCDQNGCGLNPFRYGPGTTYNTENNNDAWYGPGAANALDSTKPYTVVTQFHTADGTDTGELSNITRYYVQQGRRIDLPALYVLPPSDGSHMRSFDSPAITKDFCTDIYDRWDGQASYAPLAQMGKNMEGGMVLAMSAWYAQETYSGGKPQGTQTGMSWLDGMNNWGKYIKAGPCDATTTDTAGPYHATFSDIRFGEMGTTLPSGPAAPTPQPPAPTPAPAAPTPAPPAPSGCPGGSLQACIGLCPADPATAYQACVKTCATRCS